MRRKVKKEESEKGDILLYRKRTKSIGDTIDVTIVAIRRQFLTNAAAVVDSLEA